jgi:hypothetical protein
MLFEGLPLEDLVASVHAEHRTRTFGVLVPDIVGPVSRNVHVLNTFAGLENLWCASQLYTVSEDNLAKMI